MSSPFPATAQDRSRLTHVTAHNVPPRPQLTEAPTLAASAVVQVSLELLHFTKSAGSFTS